MAQQQPSAPLPTDEVRRIQALQGLGILDTPPEERFDRITRLACRLLGVPMALVSLVDAHRQWFKSHIGLPQAETPREVSFCAHAILDDRLFIVEDAACDPRFAGNPLVTGEPGIRFYAGQPITDAAGFNLGTLCVLDRRPRRLRPSARVLLRELAHLVEAEIRTIGRERRFQALIEQAPEIIAVLDPGGAIRYESPAVERLLGYTPTERAGRSAFEHVHPDDQPGLQERLKRLRGGLDMVAFAVRIHHRDGGWRFSYGTATNRLADPAVTGIVINLRDVTERRKAEEAVEHLLARTHLLSQRLLTVHEEERRRLAYELHDGPYQYLATADLYLTQLLSRESGVDLETEAGTTVERATSFLANAMRECRRLMSQLRPRVLEDLGLVQALEQLAEQVTAQTDLTVEFRHVGTAAPEDQVLATELYRIAQEALTNAVRHSGSSRARLSLEQDSTSLTLEVQDWGKGFDPSRLEADWENNYLLGFAGMEERARLIGARLRIRSTVGEGTVVQVRAPRRVGSPRPDEDHDEPASE